MLLLGGGAYLLISQSNEGDKAPNDKTETTGATTETTNTPQEEENTYTDVSPEEAKNLIDENADLIIIDVSPNYDDDHLPGAINYYVGDGSLDEAIPSLDKSKPYLVYCHVDSAAISGAEALIDAGFETVYRLEGNYDGWVDAGYPVEK